MQTFLMILLLTAVAGDFAAAYVLAAFYPGYSHRRQVMSVLGSTESPVGRIYSGWLIVLGLLFCSSSFAVYAYYRSVSAGMAAALAVVMWAFGLGAGILSGIFSVSEAGADETAASKIHGIGAGVGFMLLCFAPLLVAVLSFKTGAVIEGALSAVSFALSLGFFVLFVMSEREGFEDSVIGMSGLWQRALLAVMYLPLLFPAAGVFGSGPQLF